MPTLNRKLNWLFKENAQLRKDYLRLRSKWTKQTGNEERPMLLSVKPIENSDLRDWSFIRQINGKIRLKEKRLFYVENCKKKSSLFQESRARHCQEIEELRRIFCSQTIEN